MIPKIRSDRCCNPYKVSKHCKKKALRGITRYLSEKLNLPKNSKICAECRKMNTEDGDQVSSDKNISINQSDVIDNENVSQKLSYDTHSENQNNMDVDHDNTHDASLFSSDSSVLSEEISQKLKRLEELEKILNEMKKIFTSLPIQSPRKLQILTFIVPTGWSARKIAKEFQCSQYLAQKAQEVEANNGVLFSTIAKIGKSLPAKTVEKVLKFYNSDLNGRLTSGVSDVKSVDKALVQKRLLLLDLKGLYVKYKQSHVKYPIGFSKFSQLRPKYCILAGAKGTHCVCVCTIHQNCKLMLDAINVAKLTEKCEKPLTSYKDCLQKMVCPNGKAACFFSECKNCPDISILSQFLLERLKSHGISEVKFAAWTGTDRSTLQTSLLSIEDFVDELCEKLLILKPHSFIAKQQTKYSDDLKEKLMPGEVMVCLDFSENYQYVVQDASQAFHFNNDQCTVFPVVCYYKIESKLQHKSFIFLSDSTKHDAAAVYIVQSMLIPLIKEYAYKKVIYQSDGAKQHFKNRFQMVNLVHHEEDFGIKADWHCFATAHGKNACDGVGATFKREAARSSLLLQPPEAILTAEALYKWGKNNSKKSTVLFYSKVEHERTQRKLKQRFNSTQPVPKIQINHSFIVLPKKKLFVKRYANASDGVEVSYDE